MPHYMADVNIAEKKLVVSSSPHISTEETTRGIMLDVIIALIPALIGGMFFFGSRALLVVITAIISCIVSEWLWQVIINLQKEKKKGENQTDFFFSVASKTTVSDLSAVVTGLLLGLNMPATIPLWCVIIGSVFAIIIVKQFFGGLGHNFVNPAMAARAFMLASWPVLMTTWIAPIMNSFKYINPSDAVSSATPLSIIKEGTGEALPTLYDAFIGRIGGCIGETSAALIILGAIYLIIRGVIDHRIPIAYLGSFAVLMFLFGAQPYDLTFTIYNLCTGGIMLGAFFMATDYVTTPTSKMGHIVFGVGCGILTFVIRRFGGYPEGTTYAILLMNVVTPLIDRYIQPKRYGRAVGR